MKARVVLEVGLGKGTQHEATMKTTGEKYARLYTLKSLYQRKAYGWGYRDFVSAGCKLCGVYNIGTYDNIKGLRYGYSEEALRVKMKNREGRTRYAMVTYGEFDSYNDYVGYKTWPVDTHYCYTADRKYLVKVKKINMKKQQLKRAKCRLRGYQVNPSETDGGFESWTVFIGIFDLPKSEW